MSKHGRSLLHEWPKQIRERLKSQSKADCIKKPTPLVAKPNSHLRGGVGSPSPENLDGAFPSTSRSKRVSSPSDHHAASTKGTVVKRPISPPISNSKGRSLSPGIDNIGLRNGEASIRKEHLKEKLNALRTTHLYLVRRLGMLNYVVASDVPKQTYKVAIGTQECSCGKSAPCIHVLFIMLNVFKMKENDARLRSSALKNYEVDSLLVSHKERLGTGTMRTKEIARKNLHSSTQNLNKITREHAMPCRPRSMPDIRSSHEEQERCPICLRDMDDTESVVICETGCKKRLHQKCFGFWAAERQQQKELVLCPLCRTSWPSQNTFICDAAKIPESPHNGSSPVDVSNTFDAGASASSLKIGDSSPEFTNGPSILGTHKNTGRLPDERFIADEEDAPSALIARKCTPAHYLRVHRGKFARWQEVYGVEMVNNLVSYDWMLRERGLHGLHAEVTSVLLELAGAQHPEPPKHVQLVVDLSYEILASLAADPIYRVYVAFLRCFRSLLAHTPCRTEGDKRRLKANISPVIKIVLMKCVDGCRQVNRLSIATLVELCKGSSGEFSIGKHTRYRDHDGIGGVSFILSCILERERESGGETWQWCLGRLYLLDRLMEGFPREFYLLHVQMYPKDECCAPLVCGYKLVHLDRLIAVLNFAVGLIHHRHLNVKRMAQRVFMTAARLTAHIPPVFLKVCDMLVTDFDLKAKLEERLRNNGPFDIPSEFLERVQKAAVDDETVVYTSVSRSKQNARKIASSPRLGRRLILDKLGLELPYNNGFCAVPGRRSRSARCSRRVGKRRLDSHRVDGMECSDDERAMGAADVSDSSLSHHGGFLFDLDACHRWEGRSCRPSKPQCLCNLSQRQFLAKRVFRYDKDNAPTPTAKCSHVCRCGRTCGKEATKLPCVVPPDADCPVGNLIDLSSPPPVLTPTTREDVPSLPSKYDSGFVSMTGAIMPAPRADEDSNDYSILMKKIDEDSLCWTESSSSVQSSLPIIPGLTNVSFRPDEYIQMFKNEDEKTNAALAYREGSQWIRGQLLGTGAFSSCYQARDVRTGTLMAVKQVSFCRNTVDEQEAQMLTIRDEIVLMTKLDHPNVVRLLGATLQGNHYNMFVEWMPGGSVSALLNAYGPFVEIVILRYVKQVLAGLSFLHANHVLHRDLKGANLLLDSTGHHLRIGDFGAAARMVSHRTIEDEFKGQLLGTIAFMAPEVLRGEGYGRSCDVWSVGCVCIEMATAKPPWDAVNISNELALLYKIACSQDPPPIPPGVSPVVKAVALRCLQPRTEDRPSAKDVLRDSCFTLHC